ncbi:ABC-type multidrug transport system, permease component [Actinoalloteichus sp. GBA129-24]|uniref:ABC-type multidrug transport system, permease component n=2 Tax=Pseudonocardiaceae TaxID=2070 RepID=A0AAC9LDY8_9PSEU|nr:ABC-type multidrug transport system, permease component [Actinoalloteichus fjordicus]APU20528.1 ABC-type multidrug transport system, permease component [Actinoalloteichus sp. GBA129-24]
MTEIVSPATRFSPGSFRPDPGRGNLVRMLLVQARTELLLTLRHGENLLLTLLIPLALLIGLSTLDVIDLDEPRIDALAPRILALAVMSTAFTGQAIALGFDRRYGVLKRLAATALPRWTLVCGRVLATFGVVAVQLVVLGGVALLLGWAPNLAGLGWLLLLLVLGTVVFGALGVLLGGSLRAEVVLALANTVWFALLLAGGVVVPLDVLPDGVASVVSWLPSAAFAEGMTSAATAGVGPGWQPVAVLVGWGVGAGALAIRTTRLT